MNTYNVKATIITPMSVGNGSQYSPYKDYFIRDGMVHFVDTEKLGRNLSKSEDLMDEYVEGVANMDGNRSRFNLLHFLEKKLQIDSAEIIQRSIDFYGDPNSKLPINGFLKTPNNEPYIPGSSIKGAIKTALVYTDLEKILRGEEWKRQFFNKLSQIDLRDKKETGKLKEITKELEIFLKEKAEVKVEDTIERLAVSDSSSLRKDTLQAVDLKRSQIPVRQEMAKVDSQFYFSLSFPRETWESFGEKINRFAYNNLDAAGKEEEPVFSLLETAFENNHNYVYLALGFGKGIYLNSILLSLKDFACDHGKEALFEDYLKYLSPKSRKMNIDTFPNTEFKTWQDQAALGWIKLEKI